MGNATTVADYDTRPERLGPALGAEQINVWIAEIAAATDGTELGGRREEHPREDFPRGDHPCEDHPCVEHPS